MRSAASVSARRCLPLLGNVALLQVMPLAKKFKLTPGRSSERDIGKETLPRDNMNLPPTRGPAPGASFAAQDRSPPWPAKLRANGEYLQSYYA